jgi:hypothetical protein
VASRVGRAVVAVAVAELKRGDDELRGVERKGEDDPCLEGRTSSVDGGVEGVEMK